MVSKKRNETVEIKIERTDFPAKGFGTHQNRLISVKGVIQGQTVSVKTERRREHVTEAKLMQVIQALASVTYFRINVGDQVTIIIPEDNPDATWAAVEAAL